VQASAIVFGYNVFHVLPNSVYLLTGLALISFRLRGGSWKAVGLGRPKSWLRTVLLALATAVVQQALGQFVVDPLTHAFLRHPAEVNPLEGAHTTVGTLRWLVVIWTYAAFGEELSYRRYLLTRVADLGGQSRWAMLLGLLWSSAMYGFAHWYQGPAGFAGAIASGLVFGAAYLLSGKNLWVSIFAHGVSDTLALIATIFG
jgi:membrane protease YdiL (CAAX protease family)